MNQTWKTKYNEVGDVIEHVSSWVIFELAIEEAKRLNIKKIASYQRRGTGMKVYLTGKEKEIKRQLKSPSELRRFYMPFSVRWLRIK